MENILIARGPARSALAIYETAVSSLRPTAARWMEIAALLRAEAEPLAGSARQKRIDRAVDCEHRARRAAVRATIAQLPDFVPAAGGGL